MKKVLVFLLTLGLAANMFAIDLGNGLKVDGEVKTGIKVATTDDGNDDTVDTTAALQHSDAGANGFRPRITFEYGADWGGVKYQLQATSIGGNAAESNAYGWANFLGKKVVLYGGHIGDELWGLNKLGAIAWGTTGNAHNVDAISGVRVAFNELVPGLSFGGAVMLKEGTTPTPIDLAFNGVAGVLYKSSLVSGVGALRINPGTDTGDDIYIDALLGVEVNPISSLKVVLDTFFDIRKYETHGKIGYIRIGPLVQYTAGPLKAHILGDIIIQQEAPGKEGLVNGRDGKKTHTAVVADYVKIVKTIGQSGDIAIAEYTGDPTAAFRIGADYKVSDTIGAYIQIGSDNVLWFSGDDEHNQYGAGLYVKPGVNITLGSSSIGIYDKINRLGAKVIKGGPGEDDVSPVINEFQIDFTWKF